MNKKQIVKVVVFICGFLLLLRSVSYMLRTDGIVKERFVGFYAEKDNTLDMVIIGSSPVGTCYISPKIWGEYGVAAYPISTNQQRPKSMIYLVEEVLKTQEDPLFVFEIRQFTAPEESMIENMAFTRGVTDNMKYSLNRIKAINELVPEKEERYSYYLDIFKYHSNWKTLRLPKQIASYRYENLQPLKGYEIDNRVGPSELYDASHITETMAIPVEQEKYLYELLEYLKEKELEALFVVTPYTMTEEKQMKYNYIQEILETYDYPVVNFNDNYEEIGIDFQTDFYDWGGHTNARGAEKVTTYFMEYIMNHYEILDKRGSNQYKSYDESYELWLKESEEAKGIIALAIENKDYLEQKDEE